MIYILKGMFLTFPRPSAAQALAMAKAEKEAAEKVKRIKEMEQREAELLEKIKQT